MLKGKDIICHALPTWDGDYMKAVVQLMAELAQYNRVIYVNYPYTYKDVIGGMLGKNATPVKQVLNSKNRLQLKHKYEQGELYILYPPPVLPTNFIKSESIYRKQQGAQAIKVGKAINEAQDTLGFKNTIVINAFNPQFGLPLVGRLNERLTLYYCYDEINAAAWCKAHGAGVEAEYLSKVDGVIVTSKGLYDTKSKLNKNCFLVQNGVDYKLFSKAIKTENTTEKVIGYIGSIDNRLDYTLLSRIAETYPNYKVKLIGRVVYQEAYQFLDKYKNVVFTGAKQPAQLANELNEVDLGLIPFVSNEFTKNIYPLKVNEYLAAGKPVVTTNFAALNEFSDFISIANNADEFMVSLANELENDNQTKRELRNQFASKNSWTNRAEMFSEVIDDMLMLTCERY